MRKIKPKAPALLELTGNEMLEHLGDLSDTSVGDNHAAYSKVIELAGQCLRVLNVDAVELYEDIFEGNVYVGSLAEVAENNSEVRNEMEIVKNLDFLYGQLRLLKLEGKAYNVLDEFFNLNLGKTL